jgi:uncharacterized protein YbjT (DUF2867 family)
MARSAAVVSKPGPDAPLVVIGGASGFVGRALAGVLAERFRVAGMSRRAAPAEPPFSEWRRCDLLNLREAETALEGARYAIYLVHSMMPSARLTQGSFSDLDLLCADNFARAAALAGVEQIVYLGGLLPEGKELSPHLQSRHEVEQTLARHGVPVTTLRAGLVLGAGGSSFEMLTKLVRRLPAMVCPRWTLNRTQPVALDDVVCLLSFAVGRPDCLGETFDVGAPDTITYRDLMALCAELLGVKRVMIPVPFFSPSLSRLWVTLVTGASQELVGPLVESLRHEMVARDQRLATMAGLSPMPLREALSVALAIDSVEPSAPRRPKAKTVRTVSLVESVQRMRLPPNRDARWAAAEYARWLPRALRGWIRAEVDGEENIRFYAPLLARALLVLMHAPTGSTRDRQLYFLGDGLLSRANEGARFEMRQVLDGQTLLVAIHDFRPRLPWYIYIATQAPVHARVMAAFRRRLAHAS